MFLILRERSTAFLILSEERPLLWRSRLNTLLIYKLLDFAVVLILAVNRMF